MEPVPSLLPQPQTTVRIEDNTITVTFGPIDLPTHFHGHLVTSLPKHGFHLSEDRFLIGFHANIFKQDGTPLPREYLHHLLLIDSSRKSLSCEGEASFIAGSGMEMVDAHFPEGYGVPLQKATRLIAAIAFYHQAPPTKHVMASFTMHMAPKASHLQPLEVYPIGINTSCYRTLPQRPENEIDDGILLQPGLQVNSAPVNFTLNGCVKFAYPHGHNQLVLVTLENTTTHRTLLRTVPTAGPNGTLLGFPPDQIYSNLQGFSVNTHDQYEMTMVYYRSLQSQGHAYGMANYLLYLRAGECSPLTRDQRKIPF